MESKTVGISALAASLVIATTGLGAFYTVDQGERAVITRNGKVVGEAGPGMNFKTPWLETVYRFSTRTIKMQEPDFEAYSKDLQPINVKMSTNVHADPGKVTQLYSQYGDDYLKIIVTPAVLQSTKEQIGKATAEDIVANRDKIAKAILDDIAQRVPVSIDAVQLEDIKFSDQFIQQAENKVKQQQNLDQARIKADQDRVQAEGEAAANKASADGIAYKTMVEAKAMAEAIKIKGDALHDNPSLVQLTLAQQWNGVLPTTMVPGAGVPMLQLSNK